MSKTIRVLLANDFPLIQAGIRAVVAAEEGLTLVGEAIDSSEIQRLCQELQPDILLLEAGWLGSAPFEIVIFLRKHYPTIKVLVLAGDDDVYLQRLVAAGAVGCVLRDESTEALIRAIQIVSQGDMWFSQRLIARWSQANTAEGTQFQRTSLTDREREVLQLVVRGYPNKRIASDLVISERTVRFHLRNLYDKLTVSTRGELLAWVHSPGLDGASLRQAVR